MKIIVSQKEKKLEVIFSVLTPIPGIFPSPSANSSIPGIRRKYTIDKAEEFLVCVDKLISKGNNVTINSLKKAQLEFRNIGLLTERVIRAIMLGLKFSY
jgi:hypothetical protein